MRGHRLQEPPSDRPVGLLDEQLVARLDRVLRLVEHVLGTSSDPEQLERLLEVIQRREFRRVEHDEFVDAFQRRLSDELFIRFERR